MMSEQYPVLFVSLMGEFGAEAAKTQDEAIASLRERLGRPEFREAIRRELQAAFADPAVSWQQMLDEATVDFLEENEAREFVQRNVYEIVFSEGGRA